MLALLTRTNEAQGNSVIRRGAGPTENGCRNKVWKSNRRRGGTNGSLNELPPAYFILSSVGLMDTSRKSVEYENTRER